MRRDLAFALKLGSNAQVKDAIVKIVRSHLAYEKTATRRGVVYNAVHAKLAATQLRQELISLAGDSGDVSRSKVREEFRVETYNQEAPAEPESPLGVSSSIAQSTPVDTVLQERAQVTSKQRAKKKKASDAAQQPLGKRRKVQPRTVAQKRKRKVA